MNVKQELQSALGRPVQRPEDAEIAQEAAELLGEYLRVESRADSLLRRLRRPEESTGTDFRGLTLHEAARRVLEAAGMPLHAREIAARIKAGGWRHPRSKHPRSDQMVFQLAARLPRRPEIFQRVGPNTFALTAWGDRPPTAKASRPRTGLFAGPGTAVGREIGESDEPHVVPESEWRSS